MKECNILLIEGDKRAPENEFNYKNNIRARDNVQLVKFQQLMFWHCRHDAKSTRSKDRNKGSSFSGKEYRNQLEIFQ